MNAGQKCVVWEIHGKRRNDTHTQKNLKKIALTLQILIGFYYLFDGKPFVEHSTRQLGIVQEFAVALRNSGVHEATNTRTQRSTFLLSAQHIQQHKTISFQSDKSKQKVTDIHAISIRIISLQSLFIWIESKPLVQHCWESQLVCVCVRSRASFHSNASHTLSLRNSV